MTDNISGTGAQITVVQYAGVSDNLYRTDKQIDRSLLPSAIDEIHDIVSIVPTHFDGDEVIGNPFARVKHRQPSPRGLTIFSIPPVTHPFQFGLTTV
jgi:hypothetical protein